MAQERTRGEGLGLWVRVSARLPARFSAQSDYALWFQRFEREAEVPEGKKGSKHVSLLEGEPFCVVSQMGLLGEQLDYNSVKRCLQEHFAPAGMELEWQCQLQSCHQRPSVDRQGVPCVGSEGAPRNYTKPGIQSASAQLKLLQQPPATLEEAVELARQVETVEAAYRPGSLLYRPWTGQLLRTMTMMWPPSSEGRDKVGG